MESTLPTATIESVAVNAFAAAAAVISNNSKWPSSFLVHKSSGYINATLLCFHYQHSFFHWANTKQCKELVKSWLEIYPNEPWLKTCINNEFSADVDNVGKSSITLCGPNDGIYIHANFIPFLMQWLDASAVMLTCEILRYIQKPQQQQQRKQNSCQKRAQTCFICQIDPNNNYRIICAKRACHKVLDLNANAHILDQINYMPSTTTNAIAVCRKMVKEQEGGVQSVNKRGCFKLATNSDIKDFVNQFKMKLTNDN
jgi:hypothetical protein